MITEVKNNEGVTYQIDEDNNIHSCKCTICETYKPVIGFKNVKQGICLDCGHATVSDDVQALDDTIHVLLKGFTQEGKKNVLYT
ncbi:hypothetical protein GLV94_01970 [Virgibacillus halodenitrificans]|uniref:hypothetical protein n=1 Tax=Virgibacillus halodenitrificans TaxID=1482 RepID=UPI0013709503|nr:hypothetical protein [Virgibacillus halodenitrificans]MYL44401.1 hypothetical protein [Virgibacillus halodenitrificans]